MQNDDIKKKLVDNFLRIASIPRESGHEERIADFFVKVASENDLYCFKDENNNVLIKKKGSLKGRPVALQAHLDMVCVKTEDSNHDFRNEGIDVIIDGDKVRAKDTSLGADQGIGLAMMLSLIEDSKLQTPDLEFLFTIEEETTFKGAVTFPYDKVESRRMINLDNAKDDTISIGADGDICNEYYFKGKLVESNLPSYKIKIDGFPSGSSSEDIEVAKGNAITTMAEILKDKEICLGSFNGGSTENDLAAECEVVINTNLDVEEMIKGINATIESCSNKWVFGRNDTDKIIKEILELKSGFITEKMASANLGVIKTDKNVIKIYYIFRSMIEEELNLINNNTKALKNDFIVNEVYTDSIWNINGESNLVRVYRDAYYKESGEYPKEEISHGSVECYAINKRIDGLDIISVGSNIKRYHTIEEETYISSWVKIYRVLIDCLENLAEND